METRDWVESGNPFINYEALAKNYVLTFFKLYNERYNIEQHNKNITAKQLKSVVVFGAEQ